MHDNKFIQSLLKRLLQYGAQAIRKRSVQKEPELPDSSLENNIIEIFSQLLDENYKKETFKRQIINKRLPSKPGAKKIIQLLYNFIYVVEVDGKKINDIQIDSMSGNIVKMINKLNNKSRFFPFRLHLRTKILQLTKVKKLYFSSSSDYDIEKIKNDIINCFGPFTKETVLNVQNAISVLKVFNKNIALIPQTSLVESRLFQNFFEDLNSKCKSFITDEKNLVNSDLNEGMKNIISEMNILSGQLGSTESIAGFNECLETCKRLRYLSKKSNEKFDYNEKNRDNKSYSFESFEKTLSLHRGAIDIANSLLGENGFEGISADNVLSKYQGIISDKNIKILDRKFYDQQIKNMQLDVKKAMEQAASKSMFGKSAPTSNKILDKILNLF